MDLIKERAQMEADSHWEADFIAAMMSKKKGIRDNGGISLWGVFWQWLKNLFFGGGPHT